jgi:hypothetical protein
MPNVYLYLNHVGNAKPEYKHYASEFKNKILCNFIESVILNICYKYRRLCVRFRFLYFHEEKELYLLLYILTTLAVILNCKLLNKENICMAFNYFLSIIYHL